MHDAQTIPWIVDALEERLKRLTTPKKHDSAPIETHCIERTCDHGAGCMVTTHRIQRNERCVGLHVQTKCAALFGGSLDLLVCVSLSVHTEDLLPFVETAGAADVMRQHGLSAVRTDGRADGFERIVGAAHARTRS